MKKLIALMALVLCVVSCQKESFGLVVDQNGEAAVTLSVALPEGATRAAGADSALGAIDNGVLANYDVRFILEVYDVTNGTPVLAKGRMVESGKEDHAAFNLRLVPGRDYKFVVWADFVTEGSQADLHYDTKENDLGLRAVAIKDWTAIDESRDAYTASVNVPNYSSTSKISNNENGTITLTRPFAKLRVVTNDIKDMIVKPAVVKVNYFSTQFYTAFNALTEEPIDQSYNGHELVVDLSKDNYTSENPAATGEQTLFADYFFAKEGNHDRVMFNMDVVTIDGKEIPQITFNTNIPVSRNHLTTVYGPILTDANNITVIIDDKFESETIYLKGDVNVEKDFVLDSPMVVRAGTSAVLNIAKDVTITNRVDNTNTDVIIVEEGATLTIEGEGTIEAVSGNDGYTVIAEGTVIINGGTFKSGVDANNEPNAVIYARGNGKVYVNGGNFPNDNASKYVLNKKDADRATTTIEVRGGRFETFNPANNAAEGAGTNFVVDGYKSVEKNGAYYVVANTVDVVSTAQEFATALNSGKSVTLLAGEYTMPGINGKNVTIAGSRDAVLTINTPAMNGSHITLEGITVKGSGYATGIQHVGSVTYNGAKIVGEMCLYGDAVTFNHCEFELANNQYIWVYGCKNAEFKKCTFNTAGKAILVYNEQAGANNVTVNGCTFNASAGAKAGAIANQNCAAIEIDNYQKSGFGAAHKVTTSENTYGENFSGEWRIKNFVSGNAITVNGVEYTQIALDGKLMSIDANKNVTVNE